MAQYRVVSGENFIEFSSSLFSEARRKADMLHADRKTHFRVEEVNVVYHTAEKVEKKDDV